MINVGINGFGRIGKCLFRANYETKETSKRYNVVAIKDMMSIENAAYLLKYDSTYGIFKEDVDIDGKNLIINGKKIPYFNEEDITLTPWKELGVDILIESSGAVPIKDARLLQKDIKTIMYTRSIDKIDYESGLDKIFVMGINNQEYNPLEHKVISSSTCTGNAIVPIIGTIKNNYNILSGHLVTIHPFLPDQRLLDVAHDRSNLGRSATNSIIPTSTGIAKSLGEVFPDLNNKFTAISYRVPTTIVSMIDVTLELDKEVDSNQLNKLFKESSLKDMKDIILYEEGYKGQKKVSIDFLKDPHAVIFLSQETKCSGKNVSFSLFHDNEWGYCQRVNKLINYIGEKQKEYYKN